MSRAQVIEADLTWIDSRFRPDVKVRVDDAGRIDAVGTRDQVHEAATHRLNGQALLPGFVNAHSHAFQRGLRGRGERYPGGVGSFWTWREAMYALVESLDAERVYEWSAQAFREMLASGITTVGEFHYIHHSSPRDDGSGGDFAFDDIVLQAAADVGIRIVLLQVYYRTGGINQPLADGQMRFATPDLDSYWQQFDHLTGVLASRTQSLGVVAHSIRAVPLDDLAALHAEARRRGCVFHMHLEEQPAEVEACRKHYHATPMALVNDHLAIDAATTMVHCTHTDVEDMAAYLARGGHVCICPLTEANLGDGLADVPGILVRGVGRGGKQGGAIALGSDSNARISMIEEMRLLEYGQRLRSESRGVCRNERGEVAQVLLDCATVGGARSLGIDAGCIAPGMLADFCVMDLTHRSLVGADADTLAEAIVFGATDDIIGSTAVGGVWST